MEPLALTQGCVPEAVHTGRANRLVAARLPSASQLMLFTLSWTVIPSGLRTSVPAACNGDGAHTRSASKQQFRNRISPPAPARPRGFMERIVYKSSAAPDPQYRSEEHTSELQSLRH